MVSAARARELISHEVASFLPGMEVVRDGVWARSLTDEVRAVVRIDALKGAQYDLS